MVACKARFRRISERPPSAQKLVSLGWRAGLLCFDVETAMNLPSTTSKLLELQEATNAELRSRLNEFFQRYRGLAFVGRNDNLFTEHWTPELAAAGYDFDGFEIKGPMIVLHGVENACGFIYRIHVTFPLALIDDAAAIESYFQNLQAESKAESLSALHAAPATEPSSILRISRAKNLNIES